MPQRRPDLAVRFEPSLAADRVRARGASVTELVVLTDGEEFHAALKVAVNAQQRVWRVPTVDQAAELLAAGRVGVLVLDTECVPQGAPALITQFNLEFPDLVVVVAGTHDEVSQFTRLVSEGLVYRFLQKPVSPARVRAFIDAAVRRHLELVAEGPAAVIPRNRKRRAWPRWLGLLAVVLVAIGVVLVKQRPSQEAVPPPATRSQQPLGAPVAELEERNENMAAMAAAKRAEAARDQAAIDRLASVPITPRQTTPPAPQIKNRLDPVPQAPAAASKPTPALMPEPASTRIPEREPSSAQQVAQLLRDAQTAIAAGNLVEPQPSSAKSLVAAALKLDPQNSSARQTLRQLQSQVMARAQTEIARPDPAAASRWIGEAQELGVADTELAALRRAQADSERRLRTDRLSGLARLAAQRLADDKLLEPEGDNARQYLKQLQLEDPALAAPLWQQFVQRLMTKSRRELTQGGYDDADRWLNAAQDTGVAGTEVAAARAEVQAARERAVFQASVLPSSQLRNTKYVPPTYPSKAIDQGLGGWVDLEFTVDVTGIVRDIAVIRAVPTGLFEKAAVDAAGKWRYQPVVRDGKAVEQRVAVRVQFKMER